MMRRKDLLLGLVGVIFMAAGFANAEDILMHWRLDESTGKTAADTAGFVDGTLDGTPTWAPAEGFSGAIYLDSFLDKVISNSPVNFGTAFTASVWAKADGLTQVWSRVFMGESYGNGFYIGMDGSNNWLLVVKGVFCTSTAVFTPDQWQHVVCTYDGATIRLYVNGVLESSISAPNLLVPTQTVRIGPETGNAQYFKGWVDDAVIFNRALSDAEIATMYDNGLAGRSLDGYRATNPSPADGATGLSVNPMLSFTAGSNPPSPIIEHVLYFGTNASDVSISSKNDPNGNTVAVLLPAETTSYVPTWELTSATTYYWRVDERIADPNNEKLSDPNVARGDIWSFETFELTPIFSVQPQLQYTDPNATTNFTATAYNGEIAYRWYYDTDKTPGGEVMLSNGDRGGRVSGADTSQLVINPTQDSDAGYYLCRATNADGSTDSQYAQLILKRLLAHWDMNGDLLDSSASGYHATSSDPNFPAGVDHFGDGIDGQSLHVGANSNNISAGNVLAFERDQAFSISLWVNGPAGGAEQNDSLISKINTTWPFRGYDIRVNENDHGGNIYFWMVNDWATSHLIWVSGVKNVLDNAWHHVVVTYDGSSSASGVEIYTDGFRDTGAVRWWDTLNGTIVNTNGFGIGSRDPSPDIDEFNGNLDDIRVFNYALDSREVATLKAEFTGDICTAFSVYDLDHNCETGLSDLLILASEWSSCNLYPTCVSVVPE